MSRDPQDHSPTDPNQLHKYLYAGGDPVNGVDPTGRGSILQEGALDYDILLEVPQAVLSYGHAAAELFCDAAIELANLTQLGIPSQPNPTGLQLAPAQGVKILCQALGFL